MVVKRIPDRRTREYVGLGMSVYAEEGLKMKKYIADISRTKWTIDTDQPTTLLAIQTGALLRIADAVEAIRDFVDPVKIELRRVRQEACDSENLRLEKETLRRVINNRRFSKMFVRLHASNLTPDEQWIIRSAYLKLCNKNYILDENLVNWNVTGCTGFGTVRVKKFKLAAEKFIAGKVG